MTKWLMIGICLASTFTELHSKTFMDALMGNLQANGTIPRYVMPMNPLQRLVPQHYAIPECVSPGVVRHLSDLNDAYDYLQHRNVDGEWVNTVLWPLRSFIHLNFSEKQKYQKHLHSYVRHILPDDMPYMSYKIRKLWGLCGLRLPYWVHR